MRSTLLFHVVGVSLALAGLSLVHTVARKRGPAAETDDAAVAVARSNGSGSASCLPAWVGDGVCQLPCAAEALRGASHAACSMPSN